MVEKPQTYNGDLARLPKALLPLTELPRWVVWKWIAQTAADGAIKWTKIPFIPEYYNSKAKANDPHTWGTYAQAFDAFSKGQADGIGVQLGNSDIAALDLDHCRDPQTGATADWAQDILDEAQSSARAYVETTVSGTGFRVLGRSNGDSRPIHRNHAIDRANGEAIEVYHNAARFIVITGCEVGACDQLPMTDYFHKVHDQFDAPKPEPKDSWLDFNAAPKQKSDDIDTIVTHGVAIGGRSEAFQSTVWSLAAAGYSIDEIEAKLREHPSGIASKYLFPFDRLRQEIDRSLLNGNGQKIPAEGSKRMPRPAKSRTPIRTAIAFACPNG